MVYHATLMQNIGIPAVEELYGSIEVTQGAHRVPQSRPRLSSSLPAVRFKWVGLHRSYSSAHQNTHRLHGASYVGPAHFLFPGNDTLHREVHHLL